MKTTRNLFFLLLLIWLQACQKKTKDSPLPVLSEPATSLAVDCNTSLFSNPLLAYNVGDTIRSINAMLYMHCQNKTNALSNGCVLSTYQEVLKGDFVLKVGIDQVVLSQSKHPVPGEFKLSLLSIVGSNIKRIHAIVSAREVFWMSYPDTLAKKKLSGILPSVFTYHIVRTGNSLKAGLYFGTDSVVALNPTFGAENLSIGFALESDTSGKEFSKVRVSDFQLKQGTASNVKESFGCNRNFYPKK